MMELNYIPLWLNEDYFVDILDKEYKTYKIRDFQASSATGKGENYASALYLVDIKLELKDGSIRETSYIVKTVPQNAAPKDNPTNFNLFAAEKEIYLNLVPVFQKMYQNAGVDVKFIPKCLKFTERPLAFVMENLNIRNFQNANRFNGLNLYHAKRVFKKLAQFHAASAYLNEVKGDYSKYFQGSVYKKENQEIFQTVNKMNAPIYTKCMLENGIDKKYTDKIEILNETFFDKLMLALDVDQNAFNVLNHGDFWINNIMFQYDEGGNIKELLFIDFQNCKYGSPAQDLNYFLMCSCHHDIRIKEHDNMIKYYYDELVKNLIILKYSKSIPTLISLHCDILKRGFFAVITALGVTPIVLLDKTENANHTNLMTDNDAAKQLKRDLYTNKRYIKTMEQLFPFFDNRGLLDP